MKNLAQLPHADTYIRQELSRARIPADDIEETNSSEVPYSVIGKLGPFEFRRGWTYWIVRGPMPIEIARKLYADPVGKTDIRADGDAGCRPPETWAKWILPDGRIFLETNEEAEFEKHEVLKSRKGDYAFSDDPEALGATQLVTSYHIDTEVGLRIFADTIREHKLA